MFRIEAYILIVVVILWGNLRGIGLPGLWPRHSDSPFHKHPWFLNQLHLLITLTLFLTSTVFGHVLMVHTYLFHVY